MEYRIQHSMSAMLAVPAMGALRKPADELELLVSKEYWPFPTYADLIFEVDRAEYMSDRYKKLLDAAIDLEKRGNEMLNLKHSLESKSNK